MPKIIPRMDMYSHDTVEKKVLQEDKVWYNGDMSKPQTPAIKPTVLIVDDNKDFLEIFSMKLTQAGFDVSTAQSGKEGIEKAKKSRPDLVLLDVEMPEMSGVETLVKLKEDPATATLKIVFLTNYGEPSKETTWIDEKFAREAGAMDYIKKSEDLSKIVDEVKTLLEKSKV